MSEGIFRQNTNKIHEDNGPRKPVQKISEVEKSSCDLFRRQTADGETLEEQYLSSDIQLYKDKDVCVCVCLGLYSCMSEDIFRQNTKKIHEDNYGPRKLVQKTSEVEKSSCDLFRRQTADGETLEEQYLSSDIQLYKDVYVCVCVCVCVLTQTY